MNVFQTGEWMSTLQDGYGYIPCCIMYEGAGLPYMLNRKFGTTNYLSMPFNNYGGIDDKDPFKTYSLSKAFAELPGLGYKYIVTYDDQVIWNGYQVAKRFTRVKDVTFDTEDLWTTLHTDIKASIRSAWHNDIHVQVDDETLGRELLLTRFPTAFLDALEYHMGRYYFPYVALKDGKVVAASITFVYNDTTTLWANTSTSLGRMYDADYMMTWQIIQDAHNNNCKVVDLGNTTTHWGATNHEYRIHYIVPRPLRPFMKVRQWINGY